MPATIDGLHPRRQAHDVASHRPDLVARIAAVSFLVLCLETLFSIPYRTVHLATHSRPKAWLVGLLGLVVCGLLYRKRHSAEVLATRLLSSWSNVLQTPWLSLAVGLLVRLLWIARFHMPFSSDGEGYFAEAVNLAEMHKYGGPYWPPGFPLFLSPFFMVLGSKQWVAWLCTLLLFAATWWMACRVAARMSGHRGAGVLCGWLLALWPGYIAVATINCKEVLLAFLLTAIMLLDLHSEEQHASGWWVATVGIGLLTGCAALTQPGFTLFPAVLFLAYWLRVRRLLPSVTRTVVILFAMMAVILPWTMHNFASYHRYILISTNGGSVFYTANNARANASYSEEAQRALPADTIEADRLGYELGKQWIKEHPADFAVLSLRKQVVFLGDDGIGIYETLKRGGFNSGLLYNALKGVCSFYWLLIWIVLLFCYRPLFRAGTWSGRFGIAFLPFVYQWAIDSIFESGSRHHIAYVGCLAIIVACGVSRRRRGRDRRDSHTYRMPILM